MRALHVVATAAGATLYAFALILAVLFIAVCAPFVRAGASRETS